MDENNRNFLLAIVLSIGVLLGWNYFFGVPQTEQLQKPPEQSQQAAPGTPPTAPAPQPSASGAPPLPTAQAPAPGVAPAPAGATRETALRGSARIQVETPRLKGSIALKGARIDDLVLKDYRVSVEPESANVTLLSPS
ncbi:MAG: membrane protein insertase YidC, partial [Hyphomicrobiales bacterium]|nr:membrane protein insertase YidC [Hyphomicrobiales bacterium]